MPPMKLKDLSPEWMRAFFAEDPSRDWNSMAQKAGWPAKFLQKRGWRSGVRCASDPPETEEPLTDPTSRPGGRRRSNAQTIEDLNTEIGRLHRENERNDPGWFQGQISDLERQLQETRDGQQRAEEKLQGYEALRQRSEGLAAENGQHREREANLVAELDRARAYIGVVDGRVSETSQQLTFATSCMALRQNPR